MFSALSQGSSIYLLDKTSTPKYYIGEVVSCHNFGAVNLKVKIEDSVQEFNNLPSANSLVTYNNGKLVISETKQGIQNEVESLLQSSKRIVNNIDQYRNNISECEAILRELSPQFAIDKERDDRLTNLESKFGDVESKLNEIFNYIKK